MPTVDQLAPEYRRAFVAGDASLEDRARCWHCAEARAAHGGAKHTGRCPSTVTATPYDTRYHTHPNARAAMIALAGADVTSAVAEARARSDAARSRSHNLTPGKWGIGASDTGSCPKQIEFRERPPIGYVPLPIDKRAAHVGAAIHEAWTADRRALFPWRKFSGRVHVPGLDRDSEYDEYDEIIGRLTDYKSAGEYMWRKVAVEPWESHVDQAMIYAYSLVLKNCYVREVEILYIDRATGLEESFRMPYEESVALAALDVLVGHAMRLDAGLPLERKYKGPSTSPICRKYCPALEACWGVSAAQVRGRSPESHTLVVTNEDAVLAVKRLSEASRAESEAKAARAEWRALVDGLEAGTYGDLELKVSGGRLGDPKPDYPARVRQLEEWIMTDAELRPAYSSLAYPVVQTRSPVAVRVTSVRASQRITESTTAP
jgi:hypothetical protein